MQLDRSAADAGVRLIALETVGSTNREARTLAERGEAAPFWVTALAQTDGRGRGTRTWFSPPGNLYASLLLFDPSPAERAPELAFVAALAARDAIVASAPGLAPRLSFKWPNDLLLSGEKCGGILIEGENDSQMGLRVIIGIGVNCTHHPRTTTELSPHDPMGLRPYKDEPAAFPATDLRVSGAEVTPPQLFQRLSATMLRRIAQWDRGQNFTAILGDWLSAVRGVGEMITVRNWSGEKTGRFVGLDGSGRLVLQTANGDHEKISAGDVFPFAAPRDRRTPIPKAE